MVPDKLEVKRVKAYLSKNMSVVEQWDFVSLLWLSHEEYLIYVPKMQ